MVILTTELQKQIDNARFEDDENLVFIKYRFSTARARTKGGAVYHFSKRKGVCLSRVQESDVLEVLNMRGGCCGQKKNGVYTVATKDDIDRWLSYERNL